MAELDLRVDQRISSDTRSKLRDFCSDLGSDIVSLANDLGIKVFAGELWPYESGYLEYAPTCGSASNYRIVINKSHGIERQRFTVAHELAHFVLHKDDTGFDVRSETQHRSSDIFEYQEPGDRLKEAEANKFAASLLMPNNLFVPAFERLDQDLEQIAKLFSVSLAAAERRCRELGLKPQKKV